MPVYLYSELNPDHNDDYLHASSVAVDARPRIHNQDCCVCLEPFALDTQLKLLPCGHGIHFI